VSKPKFGLQKLTLKNGEVVEVFVHPYPQPKEKKQ
jgi:hypothetical protein